MGNIISFDIIMSYELKAKWELIYIVPRVISIKILKIKNRSQKMDKPKRLVKFPVSTKSLNPEIKIYYQNLSRKCRPRKNHFCYPESGLFFKNILNFCVSPSGACHSLSTRKGQISTLGKITWTYSLFRCDSISIFDHVCHTSLSKYNKDDLYNLHSNF